MPKYEARSTADEVILFALDAPNGDVALERARNSASLHGIDPDTVEVWVPVDTRVSRELERFGEEWFVDSADYASARPSLPGR